MTICIYVIEQNKTIIIYSVIMLSDAILIVNAECDYAEWRYAECRGSYNSYKMPQKRVL